MRPLLIAWEAGIAMVVSAAAHAVDLSGAAGVVSAYRDRGLPLSSGRPAIQASLLAEHDSGAYAELWGSSVGRWRDGEVDASIGWFKELGGGFSLDTSATLVAYPWDWRATYLEGTAILAAVRGPATLRAGISAAPAQRGTRDEEGRERGNLYLFTGTAYQLPSIPLTLTTGLGYENGAFDEVDGGGKWDWSAGAEYRVLPGRIGISYVGTDANLGDDHAVVGTLFVDW